MAHRRAEISQTTSMRQEKPRLGNMVKIFDRTLHPFDLFDPFDLSDPLRLIVSHTSNVTSWYFQRRGHFQPVAITKRPFDDVCIVLEPIELCCCFSIADSAELVIVSRHLSLAAATT